MKTLEHILSFILTPVESSLEKILQSRKGFDIAQLLARLFLFSRKELMDQSETSKKRICAKIEGTTFHRCPHFNQIFLLCFFFFFCSTYGQGKAE